MEISKNEQKIAYELCYLIDIHEIQQFIQFFEFSPKQIKEIISEKINYELESKNIENIAFYIEKYPKSYTMFDWQYIILIFTFIGKLERIYNLTCEISPINKFILENITHNKAKLKKSDNYKDILQKFYSEFVGIFEWPEKTLKKFIENNSILHQIFLAGILLECIQEKDIILLFKNNKQIQKIISQFSNIRNIDISEFCYPVDNSGLLKNFSFINKEDQLSKISKLILSEKIVGLDCEWKPDFPYKPAIIQIASDNFACIIDLILLGNTSIYIEFMNNLLKSENILKIGHGFINHDLKNLITNYNLPCYTQINKYYDIINIHQNLLNSDKTKESLQFLTAKYLRIFHSNSIEI